MSKSTINHVLSMGKSPFSIANQVCLPGIFLQRRKAKVPQFFSTQIFGTEKENSLLSGGEEPNQQGEAIGLVATTRDDDDSASSVTYLEVSIVIGVPLVIIPFWIGIFHYKHHLFWGSYMTLETSI